MKASIYSVTDINDIDLSKVTVKRDPTLDPYERETHIWMNDDSEYAEIETFQPVWIKYLLQHRYFEITKIWMINGNIVVGLEGRIPRNCIRAMKSPRNRFDKM